jgi:hypothetical protein
MVKENLIVVKNNLNSPLKNVNMAFKMVKKRTGNGSISEI